MTSSGTPLAQSFFFDMTKTIRQMSIASLSFLWIGTILLAGTFNHSATQVKQTNSFLRAMPEFN